MRVLQLSDLRHSVSETEKLCCILHGKLCLRSFIQTQIKLKRSIYAYRCGVIANDEVYESNTTTMEVPREQNES